MRSGVDGLTSPHPLADILPSMLREDDFARSLCAGVDEVLAPVLLTLDTYASYLDPATTPADMVPWLAQWLGLAVDPRTELPRQRHELQTSSEVNAVRGTRRSVELVVESALGLAVEVVESGGARWSPSPGGDLPGEPDPSLTVVVHPPAGQQVDVDRLDALVGSVTPAHVRHTVRVEPA
jgi:phage tail-like protein